MRTRGTAQPCRARHRSSASTFLWSLIALAAAML
jgi:hypothetical protein